MMVLERLLMELKKTTPIEVNQQTWNKFENDLNVFFTTERKFERYEKFDDEAWEEYEEGEQFKFEECDFKAETETHYASFSLEFTDFGIGPILKPENKISYALLQGGDVLYLDFDPGNHHKMKRSQDLYIRY